MKKISHAVLALIGLVAVNSAFADNIYVYGGIGQTIGAHDKPILDSDIASAGASGFTSSLNSPSIGKLQLGYQVSPNFAIEGGYLFSNNETYTATGGSLPGTLTATAKINTVNISGVAIAPMSNGFSLFAKLGLADTKEKAAASLSGINLSSDDTKTALTYGVGVQYDFNRALFVRADFEDYTVGSSSSSSRTNIWTIDVGYRF